MGGGLKFGIKTTIVTKKRFKDKLEWNYVQNCANCWKLKWDGLFNDAVSSWDCLRWYVLSLVNIDGMKLLWPPRHRPGNTAKRTVGLCTNSETDRQKDGQTDGRTDGHLPTTMHDSISTFRIHSKIYAPSNNGFLGYLMKLSQLETSHSTIGKCPRSHGSSSKARPLISSLSTRTRDARRSPSRVTWAGGQCVWEMFSVEQGVFTVTTTEKCESQKDVAKSFVQKYPASTVPQSSGQIVCDRFSVAQNHGATTL